MTMLRVVAFAAILAQVGAQGCDAIPDEVLREFCTEDCPCCAAAATDLLETKASAQAKMLFPVKKVGSVSLFPLPSKRVAQKKNVRKGLGKPEVAAKFLKAKARVSSMKMMDRWKQDGAVLNVVKPTKMLKVVKNEVQGIKPAALYDVSDDDFHKTLMSSITATNTLQEFMAEKYPEEDWDAWTAACDEAGMSLDELAIHFYTTESPNLYGPMNRMMRSATSLDDIDAFWQSYMVILQRGLETYAPFVATDTWRGVSDCSSLDVLHVGDEGVLPSFTSTSTDKDAAAGFAQGCTLLHFTGGGYDVSRYSDFPAEAELLMEEGRVYTIATAEEDCDANGCLEQFDCETGGPGDGVTGPTEDASVLPTDDAGVCAIIATEFPDFDTTYCPFCACCVAPTPPVAMDDTDCCSCCSVGGTCAGDVCDWNSASFGNVLALCNDAVQGAPDLFFGCAPAALAARLPAAPIMAIAMAGSMVAGMMVAGAAVYSFHKKRADKVVDAEQPYLYLVE